MPARWNRQCARTRERDRRSVWVQDTASGVTSDLRALRAAIDAAGHPALFVVDVVASLGAAPFAMDELGINVVLGASQKGLMCPPGLGFAAVDATAMAVCERNPMPRFYWDWRLRKSDLSYRKFCGTPPQNLLRGLEAALALIFDEGVDNVLARHDLMARTVRAAVQSWSEAGALQFFGRVPESRSSSGRLFWWMPVWTPRPCVRWPGSVFRRPSQAGWGHLPDACFASAIWVT